MYKVPKCQMSKCRCVKCQNVKCKCVIAKCVDAKCVNVNVLMQNVYMHNSCISCHPSAYMYLWNSCWIFVHEAKDGILLDLRISKMH